MTIEKDIKDAMKEKKLIIGMKTVIKGVKNGNIAYMICPNNCSQELKCDLDYYGKNFSVEIKKFDGNSRQLGEICGKPFNAMLLGVKK